MTPARALTWIYRLTALLVVAMLVNLVSSALSGDWLLLAVSVPLQAVLLGCDAVFICAVRDKAREQGALAAPGSSAVAFPGGEGCPAGACPICGMEDPDRLEPCWGGLQAHLACAELLADPEDGRPGYMVLMADGEEVSERQPLSWVDAASGQVADRTVRLRVARRATVKAVGWRAGDGVVARVEIPGKRLPVGFKVSVKPPRAAGPKPLSGTPEHDALLLRKALEQQDRQKEYAQLQKRYLSALDAEARSVASALPPGDEPARTWLTRDVGAHCNSLAVDHAVPRGLYVISDGRHSEHITVEYSRGEEIGLAWQTGLRYAYPMGTAIERRACPHLNIRDHDREVQQCKDCTVMLPPVVPSWLAELER